jgi:hypothetical protein
MSSGRAPILYLKGVGYGYWGGHSSWYCYLLGAACLICQHDLRIWKGTRFGTMTWFDYNRMFRAMVC